MARCANCKEHLRAAEQEVFCPFHSQGVCTGGCPTNYDRACVNGEEDE